MNPVVVTLPDGSQRSFEGTTTPLKVAASIGKRLEEAAIAAKVNGQHWDLNRPIDHNCEMAIITKDSAEGLEVLRHSTAHLLAHAVKELYPKSQITIGPVIEDGFYYDIDFPEAITPEDLPKIEKKMAEIVSRGLEVSRQELPREKAVQLFKSMGEDYKAELIASFPPEEVISAYSQGEFVDLCRGPHVPNTKKLGKFKLLSLAGAYWRGNENNKMLTRIYGTAFPSQKELEEHLHRLEEARKRDHRKLGPELGLFTFLPIAPAMPFYLPKGAWLFNALADFMRKETQTLGFEEVICPQLMTADLWKTSGHWEHYRDNMFVMEHKERDTLCLKPMNCPGHAALFGTTKRSYRELPLRFSEYSKLHRDERAGVTHGILRTRTFSQDDGHIFCAESQIGEEAKKGIAFTFRIYDLFGFNEVELKLATRPEKFLGTPETWDKAEKALQESLESFGRPFTIAKGEGAFYGPKIEFHIKDSLKRTWQCGTIQLDFGLPERFQLEYTDSDGKAHRPVMIHRAVLGSIERFFGILVEHHNGHFPFWISPIQALVLNVTSDQEAYAEQVAQQLKAWGLRVETDLRNEKLGYKIREAQLQRVPFMLVLGNKEKDANTLSVRKHTGETLNDLTLEAFKQHIEPLLKPGGETH